MSKKYISTKETIQRLGVCAKTLRRWADEGKIDYIVTPGKWRKYNIENYIFNQDINNDKSNDIDTEINDIIQIDTKSDTKIGNDITRNICYCRVSSNGQKEDLERQVEFLKAKFPTYSIITDIGSGINFKRKGLQKNIQLAIEGKIDELVVTYKDRLCRIGYELIEFILHTYSNAKITIFNKTLKPKTQEITEDLIEIITIYSSRLYGNRAHKAKK